MVSILSDFKLAGLVCSSAHSCQQWAGPIFHSLLSAHHLIGAYFLTTESDKRMRLLTRFYGILKCTDVTISRDGSKCSYPPLFDWHLIIHLNIDVTISRGGSKYSYHISSKSHHGEIYFKSLSLSLYFKFLISDSATSMWL